MSGKDELEQLRHLLAPLVESFELDDPARGLVAWIAVAGGSFAHPLTREPIARLRVYGAGADRIKIAEPLFMRTLPRVAIVGMSHPTQLCAAVARKLGESLAELGRIRDAVAAMGIAVDLEHDVIRLRGRHQLGGVELELTARAPSQLTIVALGDRPLGATDLAPRSLQLSGQPQADLAELSRLVRGLERAVRRESVERRDPPEAAAAAVEEPAVDTGSPGVARRSPARFAPGTSDVVELTELVEEAPTTDPPATATAVGSPSAPQAGFADASQGAPDEESLGAWRIDRLFETTGPDTEISAHRGRLRLKVPLKVVQGEYTFYLEQVDDKRFRGFLVSPRGNRHKVDVDLSSVMDLKEVFDRVMLGK